MEERKAGKAEAPPAPPKPAPVNVAANGKKNGSDDERREWQKTLRKLNQQAEESETKIGQLEERKKRLEVELADPATYGDDKLMQAKNDEYSRVKAQIGQLQDEWETAMLDAEEWEKKLA
jgi:ATP-binding cassette subfamily F protein 3